MSDLLIRNARPMAGAPADILIRKGRIAGIGAGLSAEGVEVLEAEGTIVIPALIEAHTHLDKTAWGLPWYTGRKGGSLQDLIDNERDNRLAVGIDPFRQPMRHAIQLIANGTSHIRSHADIDTTHGLTLFEGIVKTRAALAGLVDIQIVAFPQSGLLVRPGTYELMDAALSAGADVVGGLDPSGVDADPKGHLDAVFRLAEKHGKPIDIHLHEAGDLGARTIEMILERTEALSMRGMVGISHEFALGSVPESRVAALFARLVEWDVALFTTGHPSATVPSLPAVRAAGIRMGMGCDGIRDTWGPWGQPCMLHRARIVGMKNRLRRDDELELLLDTACTGGAASIGVMGHEVKVGAVADLTAVAGETLAHAVVEEAVRPFVVKGGRVVARAGTALVDMP